jgi:hypothetical protein
VISVGRNATAPPFQTATRHRVERFAGRFVDAAAAGAVHLQVDEAGQQGAAQPHRRGTGGDLVDGDEAAVDGGEAGARVHVAGQHAAVDDPLGGVHDATVERRRVARQRSGDARPVQH